MKRFLSAVLALSFVLLPGCSKDPLKNLDSDEARIYITKHDNTADFRSYNTFSVADSVAIIRNNQLSEKALTDFDMALKSSLSNMMQQRGYTQVSKDNNPDLVINVSRLYNDVTGLIDYGLYYNSYFGYYDPFYWGYPGYNYYFPPTFYGTYTIRVGGVSIDMFDAVHAASANELKLVWNGLIRGSGTFSTSTIDNSVMSLFAQSPYLDGK